MTIIGSMIPEMWSATDKIFCHLAHFLPFYPRNSLKNQNFEKMEITSGDIIILHKCIKNQDHVILFLRYGTWQMELLLFSLDFLPFYPLTVQKSKLKKNEKNFWRHDHFTYVYQKLWSDDVRFLRNGARRTDRRKKCHIEVGAHLKSDSMKLNFESSWNAKMKYTNG